MVIIRVRTLDGKETKLEAEDDWTVKDLKKAFGEFRGQDFSRVNFHYRAQRMKDDSPLSRYNIEEDGFVMANIRSVGGFNH